MLKVKIRYISFYPAERENAIRAYINCKNVESKCGETFSIIAFFLKENGKDFWAKENNETATMEILLDALNAETVLTVDTKPSEICPKTLLEGTFHFEK